MVRHKTKEVASVSKKQYPIVTGKDIFVGLEDAKRTWKVCVRCEHQVVHETSMPALYPVLRQYLQGRYPDCRISVIYEASFRGFGLHDHLVADGIACVVTPPHLVTQEKVNRVKTDRIDARRLATVLESGDYQVCHVPDPEWRQDRQVVRLLGQLRKDLTRTKNRIRQFVYFHGLADQLPARRWRERDYQALAALTLPSQLQTSLELYLADKEMREQQIKQRQRRLQQISRKPRWAPLVALKQSCPGIGWLTAIRLTLEWGDLSRFPDGARLSSFAGLTASEYSTGQTVHRGRITRQGNGPVRGWLVQCAWRGIRQDPVLAEKFQRVWTNSGNKKKAIVALARTLVVRLWAVETSGRPYVIGRVR